jgi:predicted RNA-binding Zn-ribbon protein involved in translation (DUF1610 family)
MDFKNATQEDAARFADIIKAHDAEYCSACDERITLDGCYASGGQTEAGTEYSTLSVACPKCGEEVFMCSSWMPWIDSTAEFLDELDEEWRRDA